MDSLKVRVCTGGELLEVTRDERTEMYLTREEAFDLLEKIQRALIAMPTGLPSGGKAGR